MINEDSMKKIEEAIKASLPEQVGATLRAELAELAELRKKYEKLNNELAASRRATLEVSVERDAFSKKLSAHGNLETIANDLSARELKQDLLKLELKLSNERREEIKGLFVSVFRSPIVTRNMTSQIPVPLPGTPASQYNQGSAGFVVPSTQTEVSTEQES